jgi:release factor glutamine methyltransferase
VQAPTTTVAEHVGALLEAAARRLAGSGSASPRLDAQLLLARVTGRTRAELLAHPERGVPADQASAFEALVARRAAAEPVAYLLGEREFYGRAFRVDRRALIPRPETELLVEIGLAAIAARRARGVEPVVVDVGTGSGVLAITLAAETGAHVLAIDLSAEALELARENARRLGQAARVRLVQGDLLDPLARPAHVVVANLPYVPVGRELAPDVLRHEPHMALFGGPDGTDANARLLREARATLAPGATLALELDGPTQARVLSTLARALYPGAHVDVHRDGGGTERALVARLAR